MDMDVALKHGFARLMLRLPRRRAELRQHAGHPQLMELCEAYELACEAAAYWSQSRTSIAAARAAEYRALVTDLEDEVLRIVEALAYSRICAST